MSDLLGKNRRILISTDVHHPRGLAVDYDQNILYWVDSYKDTVESVEFNGNSRRILIVQPGTNFFGIALFKVSNLFMFLFYSSKNTKRHCKQAFEARLFRNVEYKHH